MSIVCVKACDAKLMHSPIVGSKLGYVGQYELASYQLDLVLFLNNQTVRRFVIKLHNQ